jgi:hypothetical protein
MSGVIGAQFFLLGGLFAEEYHLSPGGDDSQSGLSGHPWKTLAYAVTRLHPGDTLWFHEGEWNERLVPAVSGTEGEIISFRAAKGESVTLDGTGIDFSGLVGLVDLSNRSYIRIEGMRIENLSASEVGKVPVGILIQGESVGCEIVGNTITKIASTAPVDADLLGRDAHGIAVYGNHIRPIGKLLIRNNQLFDLTLGSSEAMVVNGNVDGFSILENHVHHCDNIGIDAIGYEGIAPEEAEDQARNGLIAGNEVDHIASAGNPAYGTDSSAGGIYIDGGKDIVIERNDVHHCDIGVEVASEHKDKITHHITVRSNLLRENLTAGLFIGGYNQNTTGSAEDCKITQNTFYNNDTDSQGDEYGQIYLQFRVNRCVFANNIFYQSHVKIDGENRYNLMLVQYNTSGSENVFDYNQYYGPDVPVWIIEKKWKEGWGEYDVLDFGGEHEAWGDPGFINVVGGDFTPTLIDSGDAGRVGGHERDYKGNSRLYGAGPDRGAIEAGSKPEASPILHSMNTGGESGFIQLEWLAPEGYLMDLEVSVDLSDWFVVSGEDSVVSSGVSRQRLVDADAGNQAFFRVRMH